LAMHLSLIRLTLRNFKGIKNFTLEMDGRSVRVYGRNETGKTTLPDAWNWLISGKNAAGQKDFDVKALDEDNNPIHHLEHEVEVVVTVNGKKLTLKKVFKEKWVKKKGSADRTFDGHTTDHYIDGVPVKSKEFADTINGIADEETIKLLTNLTHFNSLDWKKRREILVDICGDVSDEDVINSDKKLAKLPEIIGNRTMEKHKDFIKAKMKELNDKLEEIPNRIDENDRMLPDITGMDEDKLREEIETLQAQKKKKESALMQLESGGEIAQKRVQLNNIRADLMEMAQEVQGKNAEVVRGKTDKVQELESQIRAWKREGSELTAEFKQRKELIAKMDTQADNLRALWKQVDEAQFEYETGETVCPTCGQDIPQEQLEEARAKAEADFNEKKAERLDSINADGLATVKQLGSLEKQQDTTTKRIKELVSLIEEAEKGYTALRVEIESLHTKEITLKDIPGCAEKMQEAKALEEEIATAKEGSQEAVARITEEIAEVDGKIGHNELLLRDIDNYNKGQKRINELRDQEKKLSKEYQELESEDFLMDLFTKTKVQMLEEKINSRFQYTKFKMFKQNINGGIEECCEAMHKGVLYKNNLNNGAKTNVGVDCINVLSDYFDFRGPVFIDNFESVTKLIDTDAQVISLIHAPDDKSLRVEVLD